MNLKLRALVVDDSRVMRTMVMETLKKVGSVDFEFVEAEDGQDALNKAEANDFQIAFVDWNMPNMTGIEFVKAVRAQAANKEIEAFPIVMVTSEKTMGKIQEALDEAGAEAFITKPFTVEDMQRKLPKVIEKAVAIQMRKLRRARERAQAVETESPKSFFGKLFN